MSYSKLYFHFIFRTKYNLPTIDIMYERELYAYMMGIIQNTSSKLLQIGGMPDHLHLAVELNPQLSVSYFMQQLKGSSSKWLGENPHFPMFQGWANGYAAFSFSKEGKNSICAYIRRQKEHHRQISFADEYRSILLENECTIDERYFLKD